MAPRVLVLLTPLPRLGVCLDDAGDDRTGKKTTRQIGGRLRVRVHKRRGHGKTDGLEGGLARTDERGGAGARRVAPRVGPKGEHVLPAGPRRGDVRARVDEHLRGPRPPSAHCERAVGEGAVGVGEAVRAMSNGGCRPEWRSRKARRVVVAVKKLEACRS